MTLLSFPCTVSRYEGNVERSRHRSWISGHDLRALAVAATEQLDASCEACEYLLHAPRIVPAGVFLEVVQPDARTCALVGPMGGPAPPADADPYARYRLDDLLARIDPGGAVDARAEGVRTYPVIVTCARMWPETEFPPVRGTHEAEAAFARRVEAAERVRLARARHEGLHFVRYDVAPERWQASDLEALLAECYRLLPAIEPRWKESGAVMQALLADPRQPGRPALEPGLQVWRGEYSALLRLPVFPSTALAEWIGRRPHLVCLPHPPMTLAGSPVWERNACPSLN